MERTLTSASAPSPQPPVSCVCVAASLCYPSGNSALHLSFQETPMLRDTHLQAGPGAPGGCGTPFLPPHHKLAHLILITCRFVCPGSPLPFPAPTVSSVRMFLIVVPRAGHMASARRVLLLEWQMRRTCGTWQVHYSLGLRRLPLGQSTAAAEVDVGSRPRTHLSAHNFVQELVPPQSRNDLSHPRLSYHVSLLSSSLLAPWFTFALSPRPPAGSRRAAWGAWRLAAVRPWHSCFLSWGFPTGVRLLQGHVLPPGQHRSL